MATTNNLDSGHRLAFIGVSTSVDCATRDLFRGLVARGHDVVPIRAGVSEIEGVTAYAKVRLVGRLDGRVTTDAPRIRITETPT